MRLTAQRVLRPDGSLRPGALVVGDGRIIAVEELDGDAPDRTLSPGLVDVQVNGFGADDVNGAGDLEALGWELARRGTTAWCPTLVSHDLDWYGDWFSAHPSPFPGEIGVHLEGPFIAHPGAHDTSVLRPPVLPWLEALPPRVALVTLAPELPGAVDAIAVLVDRGVVVSLGHSDATYDEAVAAIDAGAGMVTHVFNGMPGLHHRAPGLVAAALTDDRVIPAVIGDGVHVHPAVLKLVLTGRPAILVSDAVAAGRLDVSTGAARLPDGTLAGSVITTADAVRCAVGAGVGLGTALAAATAAPARLLGLGARGTLAAGARADIVAFGPDLGVEQVWVEGQAVGAG